MLSAFFLLAIYSQNAILKIKLIKSSAFRDFQEPKIDQILRKIARFLHMRSSREAKNYKKDVLQKRFIFG
jgi:hypothetical protein